MVRMYKDTLLNTHMRKKKDELGGLECTFEGFLCFKLDFNCPFPFQASFLHTHKGRLGTNILISIPEKTALGSEPRLYL